MPTQKEYRAKLVEALRGDRYEQGKYMLRSGEDNFCCLGVACDLIDSNKWGEPLNEEYTYDNISSSEMSEYVRNKYGFSTDNGNFAWSTVPDKLRQTLFDKHPHIENNNCAVSSLMMLNDHGVSFDMIADIIENTPGLFVED